LNSGEYHGIAGVTTETGATPVTVNTAAESKLEKSVTYSEVFGREIARLGEKDDSIVLISAAMKHATGCNFFNKKFPDRFYDGGIAEAHCATFAAGLASMGKIPVFAVYSTFSQRAFDRFLHDCAIENLHVVIAIDRAGVVGEDGETHQGLFDVAMFSMLPNFTVFSPCNSDELRECLHRALYEVKGAAVVRYPRGQALPAVGKTEKTGDFRLFEKNSKKLIITYGRLTHKALSVDSDVLQLVKIKPLPEKAADAAFKYNEIVFCEEGIQRGGIGEAFLFELIRLGWKGDYEIKAAKGFIPAGDVQSQLSEFF
jgi:1-deoxy-D-xylulose-5-phosphate synthase